MEVESLIPFFLFFFCFYWLVFVLVCWLWKLAEVSLVNCLLRYCAVLLLFFHSSNRAMVIDIFTDCFIWCPSGLR